MKNGLKKIVKGIFGIFVIKSIALGIMLIYQACETESNLPQTEAKDVFIESLQVSRSNFSNIKITSNEEFNSISNLSQKSTEITLTEIELIKTDPTDEVQVNDFGELTDQLNDGSLLVKPGSNDENNDDSENDEYCTDVNGEEMCLSVYIDESEVEESLVPAIQAARNFLYTRGFSDSEINTMIAEENGKEEDLIPVVAIIIEHENENTNNPTSYNYSGLFINGVYAQAAPELTTSEVLNCAASAIGVDALWALGGSSASAWTKGAIKKAFGAVAKRFLGPVGVAIAVVSFGLCIVNEAQD